MFTGAFDGEAEARVAQVSKRQQHLRKTLKKSLCALCVSVPLWLFFLASIDTEARRTQRLHREAIKKAVHDQSWTAFGELLGLA